MKVFIVADLEGCSGVVAGPDEERDGEAMAGDVNAAIEGAFAGGATGVVVRDFHCSCRNMPPEKVDPRAVLIRGSAIPHGGAEFDSSYDMLFLIGFHPPTEDPLGITCHTFDEGYALRLNGVEMGEAEFLAALAGSEGVGVGLVSGDERFTQRFSGFMPEVPKVITKRALSSTGAECRSPSTVREELRRAAEEIVAAQAQPPKLVVDGPYHLEATLPTTQHALVAEWIPQLKRIGPRLVRFESPDLRQVFRLIYLLVGLSSIVADWR